MTRVAVIEIGSRAVRLLVAEVSLQSQLRNILTASEQIDLVGASRGKKHLTPLEDLLEITDRFRIIATESRPKSLAIFGTEATRRLDEKDIRAVQTRFPEFRALSKPEEAELSFLAAVMEIPGANENGTVSLVIDQGSGSMEVVVGELKDGRAEINETRSYKLGTSELVSLLHDTGTLSSLRATLDKRFSTYRTLSSVPITRPIILGSAATKLAWLEVRGRDLHKPYDPLEVHGRIMKTSYIDSLVRVATADAIAARALIQPRDPNPSEFERVISGLVALRAFLSLHNKAEFVVSCKGTRYGLVWKIALSGQGSGKKAGFQY